MDPQIVNEQKHKRRLGELRRQLKTLEQDQLKLEAKGIQLERQLRSKVRERERERETILVKDYLICMSVCLFTGC